MLPINTPPADSSATAPTASVLRLSKYAGVRATTPRGFAGNFDDERERQFAPSITDCQPCIGKHCPAKLAGALYNYAELRVGGTRSTANVIRVHALAFDLDHEEQSKIDESKRRLAAAGLTWILTSTHSHRPHAPRLRLTLLPSRAILPSEYGAVWRATDHAFALHADTKAADPCHVFFDPSVPKGNEFVAEFSDGRALDVDQLLADVPPEIFNAARPARSGSEWQAMLDTIGSGRRNSTLASLAGALFRQSGLNPTLAFELLHAVNEARCKPPLTTQEVNTIAASIARKEGRS